MHLTNKVLIIDDFYKDPDAIRQLALNQEFLPSTHPDRGGNWPGLRSKFLNNINPRACEEFRDKLMGSLLEGVKTEYYCYFETNFQLCYEDIGDSWVHYDFTSNFDITHVGLVYLNPDPPENSGTVIYEFDKKYQTELDEYSARHEGIRHRLNRDQDSEEFYRWFKPSLPIPNKYNRAIVYNPWVWHKADRYFGNTPETGRLTQPFFCQIKYKT